MGIQAPSELRMWPSLQKQRGPGMDAQRTHRAFSQVAQSNPVIWTSSFTPHLRASVTSIIEASKKRIAKARALE